MVQYKVYSMNKKLSGFYAQSLLPDGSYDAEIFSGLIIAACLEQCDMIKLSYAETDDVGIALGGALAGVNIQEIFD